MIAVGENLTPQTLGCGSLRDRAAETPSAAAVPVRAQTLFLVLLQSRPVEALDDLELVRRRNHAAAMLAPRAFERVNG